MKLFKISQDEDDGYDTYDSAVVVAENEDDTRKIHPDGYTKDVSKWSGSPSSRTWATDPSKVSVEYIGEACESITEEMVVVASFNAG